MVREPARHIDTQALIRRTPTAEETMNIDVRRAARPSDGAPRSRASRPLGRAPALLVVTLWVLGSGCGEPGVEADAGARDARRDGSSPPADASAANASAADAATSDGGIERGEPHTFTPEERDAARAALEAHDGNDFSDGFDPERLYAEFSEFARTHFGTVEHPLVYAHMGEALAFDPAAEWIHASPHALTVGFSTTLPASSYVAFGVAGEARDRRTEEPERYFYRHLHHLTGLSPDTTYAIELVARDERGHIVRSSVHEVTTPPADREPLPGDQAGPPYVLDRPNTTYVLERDVIADGTAFVITADDVTLDLDGHEVVYSAAARTDIANANPETAQTGIYARGVSGLRVLAGRLREGHVGNRSSQSARGLHAVFLDGCEDVELAGLSFVYHGAQVYAVHAPGASGRAWVHHNEWVDRGWEILDRHGAGGSRCLYLPNTDGPNDFEIGFNLVKRARHTCFHNADAIHDNEVYLDSWATNGFAISPHSKLGVDGGLLERNQLFLTGYHAVGFGWAHQGLVVRDNLIHMESVSTDMRRWWESYGDQDSLNGFRITNYGSGGQERDGLRYEDNTVLARGRAGGLIRGTEFFTDRTITNVVYAGGVVSVVAEDDETLDVAPIVAQGVTSQRREAEPLFYRDVHLASDVANVRFGDSYGKGDAHHLERCTFERIGARDGYHTFVFDGTYDSRRHVVLDPVFIGGARYDDVWWRRTSAQSAYTVAYTLTIEGTAGESFEVRDAEGAIAATGVLDEAGRASIPLAMATIHPTEWPESTGAVRATTEHIEVRHTPHTVEVGGSTHEIEMVEPITLRAP